jgi:hypothetical protein
LKTAKNDTSGIEITAKNRFLTIRLQKLEKISENNSIITDNFSNKIRGKVRNALFTMHNKENIRKRRYLS